MHSLLNKSDNNSIDVDKRTDDHASSSTEYTEPNIEVLQLPSGLRTAVVRRQHLTGVAGISLPSVCDTLDLSYNSIAVWKKQDVGRTLCAHLKGISTLILAHNPLGSFRAPLRNIFPSLVSLSLRSTRISSTNELIYGISGLKGLMCMDISDTPLWCSCINPDLQNSLIAVLAGTCKALQVVSGLRITLLHRKRACSIQGGEC